MRKNELKADELEEVKIKGLSRLTRWPWINPEPKDMFWGEFSVPYNVAVMVYRVKPGPDWYSLETMEDPEILDFCKKVKIEANPVAEELEGIPDVFVRRPTIVEIRARGRVYTAQKESARGDGFSQSDRMKKGEVKEKFLWNSSKIIGDVKANAVIQMIDKLEDVSSMSELTALLRK